MLFIFFSCASARSWSVKGSLNLLCLFSSPLADAAWFVVIFSCFGSVIFLGGGGGSFFLSPEVRVSFSLVFAVLFWYLSSLTRYVPFCTAIWFDGVLRAFFSSCALPPFSSLYVVMLRALSAELLRARLSSRVIFSFTLFCASFLSPAPPRSTFKFNGF